MTTLEGRVIRRRPVVDPPGEARSELWILHDLAARLGAPSGFPTEPAQVFDELARASAGGVADYSGIDYPLLDRGEPAHWPYPGSDLPSVDGTPRLFSDGFPTANGRARMVPVRPGRPVDGQARGRELTMITGRLLEHYQSGAQTRRVSELNDAAPRATAQLHPVTAAEHGIADGAEMMVTSPRGQLRCHAEISTRVRPDTVFVPFHFPGGARANRLTPAVTDPVSGMPEFKTSRVSIAAVEGVG